MSEEPTQDIKRLHFGLLLLISFALFNLGYIVDQTVRWSDHAQGFLNGVFHILFFGFLWSIYLLPWSFVVFALYRLRGWKHHRTQWVLAPAVLPLLAMIGGLLFHPPTPSSRFKEFVKTELPPNARILHYHFSGGGVTDYRDTYYFETTPEEVGRIIGEMRLVETKFYGRKDLSNSVSRFPGCPDFSTWEGPKLYMGGDDNQHWFYYLITDGTRTKVCMMVSCM